MRLLESGPVRWSNKPARTATVDAIAIAIVFTALAGSLAITAVAIIHRSSDRRLSAALSPSGAEIIQLRTLGIDLVNAETGQQLDHCEFITPWRNVLRQFTPEVRLAAESPMRQPDGSRSRVSESNGILTTRDSKIVLALLYEDGVLWWNRETRSHRFLNSPRTRFLRVAIDETRNRFYAECIEAPEDPYITPPPEDAARDAEPWQFDAVRTIRLYELSSGKFLKSFSRLRIGQSVQNRPDLRVFARFGAVELADWPDFPEGIPKTIQTYRPDSDVYDVLVSNPSQIISWKDKKLTIQQINFSQENSDSTFGMFDFNSSLGMFHFDSRGASTSRHSFPKFTRKVCPLSEIEGRLEVSYTGLNNIGPADIRVIMDDVIAVFRDKSNLAWHSQVWSAAKISPNQIRVANENGLVFDFDPARPKDSRFWLLPLPPHQNIPRSTAALLAAGAIGWLVYSLRKGCFFAHQGWLILLSIMAWPLILCGIERGFTGEPLHEYFACAAIGLSFLLFIIALVGMFHSRGRSRAGAVATCTLLSLLAALAALNWAPLEVVDLLRPFRDPRLGDDFLVSIEPPSRRQSPQQEFRA